MAVAKNPLIGKFFHSRNRFGKVEWQGRVIGSPEPGIYLVQLFEWGMGEPNIQRLVTIEDMVTWLFYPDGEAMDYSYQHGAARAGGPYRDPIEPPSKPVDRESGKNYFAEMRAALAKEDGQ